MVQSESSNSSAAKDKDLVQIPKRSFTIEFLVGVFMLVTFAAVGYLSIGLGGLEIGAGNKYPLEVEFDNISGLKNGASVEIAGVKVGEVVEIKLEDPRAIVGVRIVNAVKIQDDDIFAIRTKGIIGDRYIKISRGASENYIKAGGRVVETESVVDLEDLIGKLVHNFTNDDEEEENDKEN